MTREERDGITPAVIRKHVTYNPETGTLVYVKNGKTVGSGDRLSNYLSVYLPKSDGELSSYSVHRIVYIMHTGEYPLVIDHIDGNRRNNRMCNLRNVTRVDNANNRHPSVPVDVEMESHQVLTDILDEWWSSSDQTRKMFDSFRHFCYVRYDVRLGVRRTGLTYTKWARLVRVDTRSKRISSKKPF